MRNDNRPEINYRDCEMTEYLKEEWDWLTAKEKATCLSYRMFLNSDKKIPSLIIQEMNLIHEKNPDFNVACIPGEKQKEQPMSFETMDFSNFLQDEPA